jgi:hypothetical protein
METQDPPRAPNYIELIARSIGVRCGLSLSNGRDEARLLHIYALLVLTVGPRVTAEHVHDAWSAWRCETRPDHPSLIPFEKLTPEVQKLDDPYVDAIRWIALELESERRYPPEKLP